LEGVFLVERWLESRFGKGEEVCMDELMQLTEGTPWFILESFEGCINTE
jgi:hypothetical protein